MEPRLAHLLVALDLEGRFREAERQRLANLGRSGRGDERSSRRWLGSLLVGLGRRVEAAADPASVSAWSTQPTPTKAAAR